MLNRLKNESLQSTSGISPACFRSSVLFPNRTCDRLLLLYPYLLSILDAKSYRILLSRTHSSEVARYHNDELVSLLRLSAKKYHLTVANESLLPHPHLLPFENNAKSYRLPLHTQSERRAVVPAIGRNRPTIGA